MKLFKFDSYDLRAFKQNEQYAVRIQQIYDDVVAQISRIAAAGNINPAAAFTFRKYPHIQKQVDELFAGMAKDIEFTIKKGTADAWAIANAKNDKFLEFLAKETGKSKRLLEGKFNYGARNQEALKAFQLRKEAGLNLSQRVWKYTSQAKDEIELSISAGFEQGDSAAVLSRKVKEYLNEPDRLFRRIRSRRGNLIPSKAMKAYKPGQGVYRSSSKNAKRLARTEINMGYRTADYLRWSSLDFVRGIQVKLSNNPNHCPTCQKLAGIYPKTFKFVGWHPQCRCYAIPYLVDQKAFVASLLSEDPPEVDYITDLPANFKGWYKDNADKISRAKNIPYFILALADLIKSQIETKSQINISDFIKSEEVKNSEVKALFMEVANVMPDWFRNGVDDFKFLKSKSYLMQHSMSYKLNTMEWVNGSSFSISTNTFANGFNPANDLKGAIKAIRDGEKMTFNQEYAMESLWHEILHARTKSKPQKLTNLQRENMETVNQFVARHTYDQFIELLGGKSIHKAEVLEKGYGYGSWIKNFRAKLAKAGISESDALKFLQPHLFNDYGTIGAKLRELFSNGFKVKS
ncbi:MAG: hypothetical protein BGO31_14270 [Bacteroidetes bacterium 43-16]|nr:MAG: hypothetical protein BGO31_14270 [Bacteroidetes bacterium 43-16]